MQSSTTIKQLKQYYSSPDNTVFELVRPTNTNNTLDLTSEKHEDQLNFIMSNNKNEIERINEMLRHIDKNIEEININIKKVSLNKLGFYYGTAVSAASLFAVFFLHLIKI